MGIITKKTKIILSIILFLEIVFLVRTYLIYSFYTNDETYGDGVADSSKYDNNFYSAVFISLLIMLVLMFGCVLLLKKLERRNKKIDSN